MQYNSQREKLVLREYGRTIQDMVSYCLTITERERRQQCAEAIVGAMASMNPQLRQQPDYQRKLWDQLALMSGYKLDIDYPYDITRRDEADAHPAPLKYPMQRIRYRHYGHLLEAFMRKLQQLPDEAQRQALAGQLADAMKQDLYDFNRGALDEGKIRADIMAYTDGTVQLSDNFRFAQVTAGRVQEKSRKKKRK